MKHRYRITYVGEDCLDCDCTIWAKDRDEAISRARKHGAVYVASVEKTVGPWRLVAIVLVIAGVVLWCLCG